MRTAASMVLVVGCAMLAISAQAKKGSGAASFTRTPSSFQYKAPSAPAYKAPATPSYKAASPYKAPGSSAHKAAVSPPHKASPATTARQVQRPQAPTQPAQPPRPTLTAKASRPADALSRTNGSTQRTLSGVGKAHDGDTFYAGGSKYRVLGIDTPELGTPRAEAARARLQQLLSAGAVTVQPVATDKYGRTVARVTVNGQDVAEVMRREGLQK